MEDLSKLYRKHKITAKKSNGDDSGSWQIFVNGRPKFLGLTKREVPYYKKLTLEMLTKDT
jgi:hypothetical protein